MKKSFLFFVLFLFVHLSFSQIIFEEGFENNNSNATPPNSWICDTDGWMAGEGEQNHGRIAHTGDWYAHLKWDTDHWMYKEVELVAGESYAFNMWYKTDGNTGFSMEIKWGDQANPSAMTNSIFPLTAVNNDNYIEFDNSFVCNNSGTYFIGIHGEADSSPWYLILDDISLTVISDYAFNAERLNADTLIQAGSSHDYLIEIENIGLNVDEISLSSNGDWSSEFFNADGSGPISNISLEAEEMKTIILRQSIPASGVEFGEESETTVILDSENSTNSTQLNFTSIVLTAISDFPLMEGFEDELFPPLGWNAQIENGSFNFERTTLGEYPTCIPHDNSDAMVYYKAFSAQVGQTAILVSPEMELQNEEYIVRFWMYRTDDINSKADKIEIYLSDDNQLNNADLLGSIHRTITMEPIETTNDWFEYSFTFNGNNDNKYIIFRAVSAYGWNMYLDDIKIATNLADEEAPEFVSINDLNQYADLEMPIEIIIRDDSEVTENMEGIYNVGNGEESFQLDLISKSKGNHTYTGNIPAQTDETSGTVKFVMEDILGNTAETQDFEIHWNGIAPLLEESFEEEFPPNGWTQTMAPYTWFVWNKANEEDYTDSDEVSYVVTPPHGEYQAMVGWDFQGNEQDEWLISPSVEITELADLTFETFAQIGSYDYDHFVVSISANNGPWEEKWNAFYMDNHVIQYDEIIEIPLDEYVGQSIKIAWRAYNPMYDNLWYAWFIDDVRIEKRTNVSISEINKNESFNPVILQNPFADELNIMILNSKEGDLKINLSDISGKQISTYIYNGVEGKRQYSISTSHLKAGVYICSFIQGETKISKRIIKM